MNFNDIEIKKIAYNKRYIYFIYDLEIINIQNIIPLSKKIHCIYNKKTKSLKGYFNTAQNKLEKVLELINVESKNIRESLNLNRNDIEKKVLLLMTTLVLLNSTGVNADMIKQFSSTNKGYIENTVNYQYSENSEIKNNILYVIGGDKKTNNEKTVKFLSDSVFESYQIIQKFKDKKLIKDNEEHQQRIIISFEKNKQVIQQITNSLNLSFQEQNGLNEGNNDESLIDAFALENNKESMYLSINNDLMAKYANNKPALKVMGNVLKTVSIHEGMHLVKGENYGFIWGGEACSGYAQLQSEKIDLNSEFTKDLINFAKIHEIKSITEIKNGILNDKKTDSKEIKIIKDFLKNEMTKEMISFVDGNPKTIQEKERLIKAMNSDRVKIGKEYINYYEYLQIVHPNDIQFGLEGGFIHNFAKTLIDNGNTPLEAFKKLEKLNEKNEFEQYSVKKLINNILEDKVIPKEVEDKLQAYINNNDQMGFIKEIEIKSYHNILKQTKLAMYDSCAIYDDNGELKKYFEKQIQTDKNFLYGKNFVEKTFSKVSLEDEYKMKNKLLEIFDKPETKLESKIVSNTQMGM